MYLVETVEDVAGLQVADPDNLAYVTQTTLSVDDAAAVSQALKARFPNIVEPKKSDICYATQNRQDAVKIWRRIAIWCWWSAARTARTPTVCAKWPSARAWPRI